MTDEETYLELTIKLLVKSVTYYERCYENENPVDWTSWSRIHALSAYDWVFPHLPEERRVSLGQRLLAAVENGQPTDERAGFTGENWSGPESGFYGTPALQWYAGLVFHGEGIDDELAADYLAEGYASHIELLEHRSDLASDDGNPITPALHYALGRFPFAEFNFFHTLKSATGRDIAADWPYVAKLPEYVFWNWLPGGRVFGIVDNHHVKNRMPFKYLHMHLSQVIHFYRGSAPRDVAFAKWLRERVPKEFSHNDVPFAFTRFLLSDNAPGVDPRGPPTDAPDARQFENIGQVFFRSSHGRDDTYAQFTAGGRTTRHKHYDHNNFTIYRNEFLALDTGARPQPGGAGTVSEHLLAYYPRTVAQNCVSIRMPDEEFPGYWGKKPAGGST